MKSSSPTSKPSSSEVHDASKKKRKKNRLAILLGALLLIGALLVVSGHLTNLGPTISTSEHSITNTSISTGGQITNTLSTVTNSSSRTNSTVSATTPIPITVQYTITSPPIGQWIVVRASYPILLVSASNTGSIPVYHSLASLNKTTIGYVCTRETGAGACNSWQYLQQTGWFWESANYVLVVHCLGGENVTLTVVEQR